MTENEEDKLAFMARQLLEMNQSLVQLNAHLGLIKGWMDGQEDITRDQGKSLRNIETTIKDWARLGAEYRGKVDKIEPAVLEMHTTLGGVAELAKSTFDMVLELKLKQQRDIPGGENAQPTAHQAAL
jgi:hypothetical protein